MNKLLYFFIITLFIVLFSCQEGKKEVFSKPIELLGTDLQMSELLGRSFRVYAINGYLLFQDDYENTQLTMISLDSSRQVYRVGTHGQGPNELVRIGAILPTKDGFTVHDGGKATLFNYNINQILDGSLINKKLFDGVPNGLISMESLSDSVYVYSGLLQDEANGEFLFVDGQGDIITSFGKLSEKKSTKKDPLYITAQGYQTILTSNKKDSKIAAATRFGDILQVIQYNKKNKTVKKINEFKIVDPVFETYDYNGSPNFATTSETLSGYRSITSTEEEIYALYSGEYYGRGLAPEDVLSGNQIRVFNWDGKPQYVIQLDRNVTFITVDYPNMYALYDDPEKNTTVIMYDLSKINI